MKLPDNAKRVFEGTVYDTYQWDQKMFDGSTETFEGLKRKEDSVAILATKNDKVLIAYEEQPSLEPFYSLFGGGKGDNEDPLVAAKREFLEETGMESDDWDFLKVYDFPNIKIEWNVYEYIARNCKKVAEQDLHEPGEKITIKELTFEEFLEVIRNENFRNENVARDILSMNEKELEAFKKRLFT